jgi:hypothetical protein
MKTWDGQFLLYYKLVFDHEGKVIILEDDCLPANSFFYFCYAMPGWYRFDNRINDPVNHACRANLLTSDINEIIYPLFFYRKTKPVTIFQKGI